MNTENQNLQHAHRLIAEHDFTGALRLLEKSNYSSAAQRAVAALRSLAFAMSDDKENALSELETFQTPDETDKAETLFAAGSAAFKLGFAAPAARLLSRAHHLSPNHPLVNARLGGAYLSLANYEQAAPCLEKAAELMPESGGAQLNLAHLKIQSNELEQALEHLNKAESLPDSEPEVLMTLRSDVLQKLGREEELVEMLRQRVSQGEPLATKRLVELLSSSGSHDEARMYIRQGLEQAPDNLELLGMAAELSQTQGRNTEASHYIKKALELEPENAGLWRHQASLNARRLNKELALESAEKALALTEGKSPAAQALSKSTYALVQAELGELPTAEMEYREALALHGNCVPAIRGLGQVLLQLGRIEEANELFEKLAEIAPIQGWSQLISARIVPDDDGILERMERAARLPSLEGPTRSGLLFTLASAWEKKGDYEKAWQFAKEANEATKAHLSYKPERHRKKLEREIARFSSEFVRSRSHYGSDSKVPVFIVGMPRSGTTLVEQILGSHSQVFGAGELSLVNELIHKLNAWEAKTGSRRQYPECIDDMTAEESQRFAGLHLNELNEMSDGAARVIDKLPHNFEHIGLIKLLFPKAKILSMKREPKDVALSNYFIDFGAKFSGMGFAYDLAWIGEQLVDHQRAISHWKAVFTDDILEVPYEALVDDTEGWAKKMIEHLELDWEPQVLKFQDLDRAVKTASVWQVRQPVYKSSKAKWQKYEGKLSELETVLSDLPPMPDSLPMPTLEPGLFLKGMEELESGELNKAEGRFKTLIAARPSHAAGHHFLGATLAKKGQLKTAQKHMQRSLELNPRQSQWQKNLEAVEIAIKQLN